MTRPLVVERRRLPAKPGPDPLAEIRAAAAALQDVPRESTASIHDMLFHNRRVAGRIKAVADRLERTWEPKGVAARIVRLPSREQRREITVGKGRRRIAVVEHGAKRQMELAL